MYQQFQIALTLEMNTIKIYFYCDFSFTERNTILISRIGALAQQALKMMNAKTHEQ